MKQVSLITLVLLVAVLTSCRPSFDLANLQAPPVQGEKIPFLDLVYDESVELMYPAPFVESDDGSGVYEVRPLPNTRLQDLKTISQRSLYKTICVSGGPSYGTANLKVSSNSVMNRGYGLLFVSAMTLFIPNLIGLPMMKVESVVELEMEIYDANGQRLRSYIGQGFEQRLKGFYYGGGQTRRTVHAQSIQQAMADIQHQISADANALKGVFAKVGPITTQ